MSSRRGPSQAADDNRIWQRNMQEEHARLQAVAKRNAERAAEHNRVRQEAALSAARPEPTAKKHTILSTTSSRRTRMTSHAESSASRKDFATPSSTLRRWGAAFNINPDLVLEPFIPEGMQTDDFPSVRRHYCQEQREGRPQLVPTGQARRRLKKPWQNNRHKNQ